MMLQKKTKEHNPNWPQIPDYPYRILIIGVYGYGKYQFLINKRESTGLKRFIYFKAFIEYSNDMDDIYKNIKEYNLK